MSNVYQIIYRPRCRFRSRQPPFPPTSAKLSSRWSSPASSQRPLAHCAHAPRIPPSMPALWRTWETRTRGSEEAGIPLLAGSLTTGNLDPQHQVRKGRDAAHVGKPSAGRGQPSSAQATTRECSSSHSKVPSVKISPNGVGYRCNMNKAKNHEAHVWSRTRCINAEKRAAIKHAKAPTVLTQC